MVDKVIRESEEFREWRLDKKKRFPGLSDAKITKALANFMTRERLDQHFNKQVENQIKRKKRGLF